VTDAVPLTVSPITVRPITGIGHVRSGDDLAALITDAAPWLEDGDVLVVTSKIVSKAEGNLFAVAAEPGPEREAGRVAALRAETERVVATRFNTRIVRTHHGFVMAAAGIDASNVEPTHLVLLPKDPDASARALRAELRERYGLDVVVLISDTMGRPWRVGLTDVALGVAGIEPIIDYRGDRDAYGNELQITQMAPADELCAAAELVKGKYDQVPVAVIRGLGLTGGADGPGAAVLLRPIAEDMFSLGTDEARADGLRRAAVLAGVKEADVTIDPFETGGDPVARAMAATGGDVTWRREPAPEGREILVAMVHAKASPTAVAKAGATVHAAQCLLAADGLTAGWHTLDPAYVAGATTDESRPVAALLIEATPG
jgi:coenzyme F420-0:L-glutamate ligase/coenzyme F420-1:gamma-L-glutamate ligase